MDRSFLSQTPVIQASRRFVCIRPLSYENADEAQYLRTLFVGRSGEVENTTFCFFSPDGKRLLSRPARGIGSLFRDPDSLASWMNRTADELAVEGGKRFAGPPALPLVPTVRLGINVAAADNQPLVVLHAGSKEQRARLEGLLAELSGREEFIGRFTFAAAGRGEDLKTVDGAGSRSGVLVVQPDRFGQKGSVLARAAEKEGAEPLAALLREGLRKFRPNPITGFEHVREGQRQGIFWETLLPVTDPMEAHARERTRRFRMPPAEKQ